MQMQVGIDIIEIDRFNKMANDIEKLKHIFTENEINYFFSYNNPLQHIAGNFAGKEAVSKALKTGFSNNVNVLDIEILHENKIPKVNLKGGAKIFFENNGFKNIDISISHSNTMATAICIIE